MTDLHTTAPSVLDIVDAAQAAGNAIQAISRWSNARVVHMTRPLTDEERDELQGRFAALRYFRNEGDAQHPPEEGFIDDESDVAVGFPLS